MRLKRGYNVVKTAALDFVDDGAVTLGASLAFYAALSMAPLVLILLRATSLLGPDLQGQVVRQIEGAMGPQAGEVIGQIIQQGQQQQTAGTISAVVGFAVLLFSATGVFAQMQYALNTIWDVQPKAGGGLWQWLRKRILSLGMILGIGFLLLVSLGLNTALNLLFAGTSGYLWAGANLIVSLVIAVVLFGLIYKVLPDVKISWGDVWAGAAITAILFTVGRFGLELYLGRSSVGSPYGAAGSFVVILLWIYYATLIFFFGAELTQAYARLHGRGLEPEEHAERIPEEQHERQMQEAGR
jgi:membrane protein